MIELLSKYSISEIIIFIFMIIIAAKESVTLVDWVKERIKKYFNHETDSKGVIKKLEQKNNEQDKKIEQILDSQVRLQTDIENILFQIQNLVDSDKDAIKAYITKEHHHFCYEAKWIDDYNLDCLERRFQKYKEEGGNSFVSSLMEELRNLPRQPKNLNSEE